MPHAPGIAARRAVDPMAGRRCVEIVVVTSKEPTGKSRPGIRRLRHLPGLPPAGRRLVSERGIDVQPPRRFHVDPRRYLTISPRPGGRMGERSGRPRPGSGPIDKEQNSVRVAHICYGHGESEEVKSGRFFNGLPSRPCIASRPRHPHYQLPPVRKLHHPRAMRFSSKRIERTDGLRTAERWRPSG